MWRTKVPYLCGTMVDLKGLGSEWRKKIRRWLATYNLKCFDPCVEEDKYNERYKFDTTRRHKWEALPQPLQEIIVKRDIEQIEFNTNFLICFFTKYSTGTVSELTFALYKKIPVYFVTNRKLKGWPLTVSRAEGNKVFKNFDDLKKFLIVKYSLKAVKPLKKR